MGLRNRSTEYLRRRAEKYSEAVKREQSEVEKEFERISGEIERLNKSITGVEEMCKSYCLPSFESKRQSLKRIEELKYEVIKDLTKCKSVMKRFSEKHRKSLNTSLICSVRDHFNYKLDEIVSKLQRTQRYLTENMGSVRVFEEIDRAAEKREGGVELKMEGRKEGEVEESVGDVEKVHRSVYFLSSVIKDLKSVVLSQSEKIERLDFVMEGVFRNVENTYKQVSAIPTLNSKLKNRTIAVLVSLVVLLVVLSMIKARLS